MHERTKASSIPKAVKQAVWERDGEQCILCRKWVPMECACAHYISRAHMGLGCEENILTLCHECHRLFDGHCRQQYEPIIKEHMKSKYPDWDEAKLVYSKWGWTHEQNV